MLDYDVDAVVSALIQDYKSEQKSGVLRPTAVTDALKQQLCAAVREICEWRLGRERSGDSGGMPRLPDSLHVDVEVMMACLKRIKKSVQFWTKNDGRQGYLNFTREFV